MSIKYDSIVDGEGLRTVIFTAGCPHFCQGCHNPLSWNINNGYSYTEAELVDAICKSSYNDVTFSGGDPLYQARELVPIARRVKEMGKNLWIYTGYTMEQIIDRSNIEEIELILLADVIVDGPFIEEEKDLSLPFRGSKNQRIIEMNGEIRDKLKHITENLQYQLI
ncbi:anaerobic ribonucleoside-triphosphate reductase activating protein [Evansella cellulosilytica]|nr:anaerobic ribonucleoside-triphosphate reductase activating protein [Evansella cellulosilytica]